MFEKIKKVLNVTAGIIGLATMAACPGYIGYECLSRLNPSYSHTRIEEVFFKYDAVQNKSRIDWRAPFIWDESGNRIIGSRNNNGNGKTFLWNAQFDDGDLETLVDVECGQHHFADVYQNGYGTVTKIELHLKEDQEMPYYDPEEDGYRNQFFDTWNKCASGKD